MAGEAEAHVNALVRLKSDSIWKTVIKTPEHKLEDEFLLFHPHVAQHLN